MADIQKTYIYQVYKGSTFLGVLQNVTSEFSYAQDLNSNAVEISVEVQLSADVADIPVGPILDEAGNNILDEAGAIVYEERALDVVGSFNSYALIQEDNILKVYEVSSGTPNGKIVFDGYIEDWAAEMGSSNDKITFNAISKGVDVVDYLIEGASILDLSQTSQNNFRSVYDTFALGLPGWEKVGQNIVVGASAVNISSVLFKLAATTSPVTATVKVWNSTADFFSGTPLATATQVISSLVAADYTFTFPAVVTATPGQAFFISITSADAYSASALKVYYQNSDVYAGGTAQESSYSGGAGGGSWGIMYDSFPTTMDLYFKTYYTAGATSTTLTSQDPVTMLSTIISSYVSLGGLVTLDPAIALTGITTSYTFKVNTVLEGIQKCLDLAPSNWYWFVDPATNILYFKATPTTATHRFIKGRHFNEIEIGATVQNVRNVVYFSGGNDGSGNNLFRKYTSTTSLASRRRRLERLSDNRVTLTDTADLIARNFLGQYATTQYNTPVTILDGTYDISTINVGDTVQLSGFGNFADTLLLQVARLKRFPGRIELTLGVLLRRQSDALLNAINDLDKLQTIDNPTSPS